jgi:hypothetical protein
MAHAWRGHGALPVRATAPASLGAPLAPPGDPPPLALSVVCHVPLGGPLSPLDPLGGPLSPLDPVTW